MYQFKGRGRTLWDWGGIFYLPQNILGGGVNPFNMKVKQISFIDHLLKVEAVSQKRRVFITKVANGRFDLFDFWCVILKTPLKRMSLTASRPSSTSLTARTDLSIQADQEDPETKEPTFPDKEGIYLYLFGLQITTLSPPLCWNKIQNN